MTAIMKDSLFSIYKNYFIEENLTLDEFINKQKNDALASIINEIKLIDKNEYDSISEKEIEDIGEILIKLSLIARMDLIKCINSIKNKDLSYVHKIRYSKELIDYALKSIIKLIKDTDNENINFSNITVFQNNDSISHTNRVFFTIIKFIKYYNEKINNNIVLDIRNNFKKDYLKYYKSIFKKFHIKKNISKLEHVYKYGLREILFNEMINIACAAFWHEIVNLQLFNEANSMKCYSYLKHFIKYNEDISLTVGLHNEYYGHGYGVFLNYYNSIIHSKPFFSPHYAMSFDYNDALKLNSISYFPSKVLEIVNLYDNIVFNNNKVLDSDEALSFIRENYLEEEVKIDPIIFDIFASFITES